MFKCIGGPRDMQGLLLDECDLIASANAYIAPLCPAVIPHRLTTQRDDDDCILLVTAKPGVFSVRSLLIQSVVVTDGEEVATEVFNMSNDMVLIRKGQAVSRLTSLQKG